METLSKSKSSAKSQALGPNFVVGPYTIHKVVRGSALRPKQNWLLKYLYSHELHFGYHFSFIYILVNIVNISNI